MNEQASRPFVREHIRAELGISAAGLAGAGLLVYAKHVRKRRQTVALSPALETSDISRNRLSRRRHQDSTYEASPTEYRAMLEQFRKSDISKTKAGTIVPLLAQVFHGTYHTTAGSVSFEALQATLQVRARQADKLIAQLEKDFKLIGYRYDEPQEGHVEGYYATGLLTWLQNEGSPDDLPGFHDAVADIMQSAAEQANTAYLDD